MNLDEQFAEFEKCLCTSICPGGILVFQVEEDRIDDVNNAIKRILPLLRSRNVAAFLINETVTVVVVPEARRIIEVPKAKK